MQIVSNIDENIVHDNSVVTIGTFDGLHVGHTEIIRTLKKKSVELNIKSVVITFFPHPRSVITKDFNIKLLTPLEEKKKLFSEYEIDYLVVLNFNEEFAKKSYKEFFDDILIEKVNAKHLVIGYDHKFGNDRDGDTKKLGEYAEAKGVGFTVVEPQAIEEEIVSSTKIRNALLDGEVEIASKMLKRNYFLDGVVIEGAKRGRTLGFPTANLGLKEDNKLIPKNGVYVVKVFINKSVHFGIANIGLRPTFNHVLEPITEVYIFDFNQYIYGEAIKVEFIKKLRDEKKFSSKEELVENIEVDVKSAKRIIESIDKN